MTRPLNFLACVLGLFVCANFIFFFRASDADNSDAQRLPLPRAPPQLQRQVVALDEGRAPVIGTPPWDLSVLRSDFADFAANSAFVNNDYGMRLAHQYAVYSTLVALRPTTVIESGVWNGIVTRMIRAALPDARIISLDPACRFEPAETAVHRADGRKLTYPTMPLPSRHEYLCGHDFVDFAKLGDMWSAIPDKERTLVIFVRASPAIYYTIRAH